MQYRYKTNSKKIMGDLHTPVSIYLKVRDSFPQSALLESSDFHVNENSISYIALKPMARVEVNRGVCTMRFPDETEESRSLTGDFTVSDALSGFIKRFDVTGSENGNIGLFGYTTFNCVKYTENINIKESREERNDAPDMLYIIYKYILVFNHFTDEITLIELQRDNELSNLHKIESLINQRNFANYNFFTEGEEFSTISDEEYKQ